MPRLVSQDAYKNIKIKWNCIFNIRIHIIFLIFSGSPFKFHVDSLASGYVTAYGPGLIYGVCGEPGNFTISTKGAGAGGLSLAVEGPSKAEICCHDNKDGTVSVSYLPTAPGEYKITVKFGDKHIKGSPYIAKITGEYILLLSRKYGV